MDFRNASLMVFLQKEDSVLWGKVLELREAIQDWLGYIPQTFPHYTRHTILHSDAIVVQLSKLLFWDEDPVRPVVKLCAMEGYILAASAYLHDAGMVVSDREKREILESEPWNDWIGNTGAGAKRWSEIQGFRRGSSPEDDGVRNFLADVETRFLMAEFVRRTHHLRARDFMTQHQEQLGRFALGDPVLLRTIGNVCVAHGLERSELEDRDRYPDRSDIREQQVNVRFCALLLRLGDLLDLSTDRACPLLFNAACPLPAESLAHWTQYRRLAQRLTSPDRIEITARCDSQEEHRYLKDWCQWLVDEVQNAAMIMARSLRHKEWKAPVASIDCPDATIKIEPSAEATYIPSNWRFELDHDLVFKRLVEDLYAEPHSFIRELVQNALDATRCQMYLDLRNEGLESPEFPTQVAEERRRRYEIRVSLKTKEVVNRLSGEPETRQVLVIEDPGIGMDRDVIQRYLLQVGRSYYTTYEFQRSFRFVPASRFGVGFLSVFGASDHVSVDTYKPSSPAADGPLRLVLTGPRNYLLLQRGERRRSGTRVEILLREPLQPLTLTDLVCAWCRRAEFPILVDEFGKETAVMAERKEQFTYEIPDLMREGARFAVRAFDIQRHGVEGELYVFMRLDDQGESWDAWSDAQYVYPSRDPRASKPFMPEPLRCVHGVAVGGGYSSGPASERLDFRGGRLPVPGLSREHWRMVRPTRGEPTDNRIASRWREITTDHLARSNRAKSPEGWRYKQALADHFADKTFWESVPATLPIHVNDGDLFVSLQEVLDRPSFATIIGPQHGVFPSFARDRDSAPEPNWNEETWAIFGRELQAISKSHTTALFAKRSVHSARWLPSEHLAIYWEKDSNWQNLGGPTYRQSRLVELPNSFTVAFEIHSTTDSTLGGYLFNRNNTFVQWLLRVKKASAEGAYGLTSDHCERLFELFCEASGFLHQVDELNGFIDNWRQIPGLPSELYPPAMKLVREMFVRTPDPEQLLRRNRS